MIMINLATNALRLLTLCAFALNHNPILRAA